MINPTHFQGYIREVRLNSDVEFDADTYPYSVPALRSMSTVLLHPQVTFLIGENGSGKSTLAEAIAVAWGFNPEGGSRNFNFGTRASHSSLSDHLTLVKGVHQPKNGFFLRAESFFNVASELERLDAGGGGAKLIHSYGGRSLHEQSHGESFMALLTNRFTCNGLYILDEPEAALSPIRQMAMLTRMHQLILGNSQFIIATHSPILMAYPGALILELSDSGINKVAYGQTDQVVITKEFLNNPDKMLKVLFEE
jgi:predicted ATPase